MTMPYTGDEFHHCGWNACSSSLSPLTGHAFLERRYLIIPGLRSSRLYVVDMKPDPTKATIHKIIEPKRCSRRRATHGPRTVHCGPEGIYVSTLGGGAMAPMGHLACLSWTARRLTSSAAGRSIGAPRPAL